jgi:hypothetical protein
MAKVVIPLCKHQGVLGECDRRDLRQVEHPANTTEWDTPYSMQGYQVYICLRCRSYWGCRHQFDEGTGSDDRWHRFGRIDPMTIKRHY